MNLLQLELIAFWASLVGYTLATVIAIFTAVLQKRTERTLLALMAASWLAHSIAIGLRWERIGHLPFINMFEMLSANIWGLMAAVVLGYWLLPRVRIFAALLLPIVLIVMAWMLMVPMTDSSLPPTYHTIWLFVHIGFIKLFLGAAFVALGIGGIVLLRRTHWGEKRFARLPPNATLDDAIHRCMALALIFDTLGIVAGAIWANDAWGHYWSWDPLEVWSLITWLSIGLTLHVRSQFKTSPATNAWLVIATFVIAFFTFFGIPFVSVALHKGVV
ncbi:cytochrome c biogenesis protein CcsA [Motiliproteus sediminis]|uniref:cytochrome c biogenesis protein CcsA n=1 Tax=Motiliproteus sediminis TaxID=1468178 RepID=UPI001AEF8D3A|nr:cytochrome c biogenesis protein CcsA [Motiliproteus sediminis]